MFLDKMPDVQSTKQITVLRVKPGKPIKGLITGSVIRTITHWYRNRSLPCLKEDLDLCPLCDRGVLQRYYAYYSIRGSRGAACMVELTATAEAEMVDHFRTCPKGSVLVATVSRQPGKRNNPIHVCSDYHACSPEELAEIRRLDLDPDLMARSLVRLWGLPTWEPDMKFELYVPKVANYITEVINGTV